MRGHDIAAKWIRIQWQIAGPYHLWAILFFSIIAIFSQYFLSIKLVKNVRNFLLSLPWECVCWYFLYNRNAVLYDFTTKIVYLWHGSTWQHCHARACVFSVFKALLIMNKYLYCAQTEQAPNSDSKTHVVNLNRTSRTDLSRNRYLTFFLGHPVLPGWPVWDLS